MTPDYVDKLLDEYDEWHEGYLHTRGPGVHYPAEQSWRDYRLKLRKHLLRAPGRKADDKPPRRMNTEERVTDPKVVIVDEEVDTRKQEL